MAATGQSVGKGPKPAWLKAALDCTVTGLGTGSTALSIRVPHLGDANPDLAQQDFWLEEPHLQDTALDLGARAITDAQSRDGDGHYYDSSILEEILKLGRAAGGKDVRYELVPRHSGRQRFVLTASDCPRIERRRAMIPFPRAFVVSGRLDEIRHGLGRFRILMGGGRTLPGHLDRSELDVELLRPLWGKRATVQGIVHFKPNGQARFIEARRIGRRVEGDTIFERMPVGRPGGMENPLSTGVKAVRHVDPMVLWGSWPGDEPIEELLAQLD